MRAFVFLAFIVAALASDVVVLDETNFDSVVDGSKHVFLEFFAPWCGHCKNLAPEYEIAATAFKNEPDVVIASVDCDAHKALGSRFGVTGFPTLKFLKKGGDPKNPDAYSGGRTADDIVKYINEAAGTRGRVKKAATAVRVLDKDSFDKVVDGSKHVLVEFYAPWCGHCKSLAPKYEQLAKNFAGEQDIVIANVDADSAAGRPLGEKFGVSGFPTIKFFKKGSTEASDYSKGREIADFTTFLNDETGSQRLASGELSEQAGRVAALDEVAKQVVAKAKTAADMVAAAADVAEKKVADFYAVVAKKFEASGTAFITKQKERIAKLLASDSITAEKRDEFRKKLNILGAFE